jgi:hypothetical protein
VIPGIAQRTWVYRPGACQRYPCQDVTVKEQLHARIEEMTDREAAALLRIADLRARDPLMRLWDQAPVDDEPWTAADEEAAAAGDRDIAAGDVVGLDELRRDLAS